MTDHPQDSRLIQHLEIAGVRAHRLTTREHRERERGWRSIYAEAFARGLWRRDRVRHRQGSKAVHELLAETCAAWLLVPFLSDVPGTPANVKLPPRLSAFQCEGPLLELQEFQDVEFFISPPDIAWTFVRTHEDYCLGGPYFIRREWVAV